MKSQIPNMLTVFNLLCGFAAILVNDFLYSSLLFMAALLFDLFDGMAARWLNAYSEIGKELDSLADIVSFGVVPAFLFFQLVPEPNTLHFVAVAIFLGSGIYRLAKFNTLPASIYFSGLPIPAASMVLMGFYFGAHFELDFVQIVLMDYRLYFVVPVLTGILMHSSIKMLSFKSIKADRQSIYLLAFVFITGLLVAFFRISLAALSGVLLYVILSSLIQNKTEVAKVEK
jgi:CDP-diacylglycerol---serine O-phosphatidyltransferase